MFSFQKQIRILVKLALSRRSASIFNQDFEVVLVPPPLQHGPGLTDSDIRTLLLRATKTGIDPPTSLEDAVTHLVGKFCETYKGPESENPHAPCTLLRYHHTNPASAPFGYVGVSELCCFACSLYFKAYERSNRNNVLRIRGHRNIVYPWKSPGDDPDETLHLRMLEKIYDLLEGIVRGEIHDREQVRTWGI